MNKVFLMWYVHTFESGDEDEMLIGVYSSEEEAQAARARLANKPGFSRNLDGFLIEAYELNKDHWTEGFVTV